MESKTNVLATLLGAIVILVIFIGASFLIGQKIKENFSKSQIVTNSVSDEPASNLLNEKKTASVSGKYKTIPSTGPESLGLILLPLVGTLGFYLKSKSAS